MPLPIGASTINPIPATTGSVPATPFGGGVFNTSTPVPSIGSGAAIALDGDDDYAVIEDDNPGVNLDGSTGSPSRGGSDRPRCRATRRW